jgi:hypothetical protein
MPQDATQTLSHFDRAVGAAIAQNRALMESAGFLRDESFRFFNLRLERARHAMAQLGECRDLPGLMAVQQEWVGDLVRDCADQGQRTQRLWRQGAERLQGEMAHQAEAGRETAQAAMDQATGASEAAAEAAHEAVYGEEEFAEVQDEMPDHRPGSELH